MLNAQGLILSQTYTIHFPFSLYSRIVQADSNYPQLQMTSGPTVFVLKSDEQSL